MFSVDPYKVFTLTISEQNGGWIWFNYPNLGFGTEDVKDITTLNR